MINVIMAMVILAISPLVVVEVVVWWCQDTLCQCLAV